MDERTQRQILSIADYLQNQADNLQKQANRLRELALFDDNPSVKTSVNAILDGFKKKSVRI
jgi:hypothetical protein